LAPLGKIKIYMRSPRDTLVASCVGDEVSEMNAKKRKTILRTIRLSEDIDNLLERDAQEQSISTNALISKIMTRYAEWDRIIEKTSGVTVSSLLIKALLNEISDQELEEIAKDSGVKAVKDLAMISLGKEDLDTVLETVALIGKYSTGVRASVPASVESKVDGRYVLTLHHDWGPKGGVLFRSLLENIVRNDLGRPPKISVTDDVVTVSFSKLPK